MLPEYVKVGPGSPYNGSIRTAPALAGENLTGHFSPLWPDGAAACSGTAQDRLDRRPGQCDRIGKLPELVGRVGSIGYHRLETGGGIGNG